MWLKRPFVLLFLDQQQHECSWMSLTPVSHRECQWSLSSACFVAHISEWQHSHRKRDDGQPSDLFTWAATKPASHAPMTLVMWNSLKRQLNRCHSGIRSQVQFLTINCAPLNTADYFARISSCSHETSRISRDTSDLARSRATGSRHIPTSLRYWTLHGIQSGLEINFFTW